MMFLTTRGITSFSRCVTTTRKRLSRVFLEGGRVDEVAERVGDLLADGLLEVPGVVRHRLLDLLVELLAHSLLGGPEALDQLGRHLLRARVDRPQDLRLGGVDRRIDDRPDSRRVEVAPLPGRGRVRGLRRGERLQVGLDLLHDLGDEAVELLRQEFLQVESAEALGEQGLDVGKPERHGQRAEALVERGHDRRLVERGQRPHAFLEGLEALEEDLGLGRRLLLDRAGRLASEVARARGFGVHGHDTIMPLIGVC